MLFNFAGFLQFSAIPSVFRALVWFARWLQAQRIREGTALSTAPGTLRFQSQEFLAQVSAQNFQFQELVFQSSAQIQSIAQNRRHCSLF
jgi:hypothetical protein